MLAGYELIAALLSNVHGQEYSLEVADVWHLLSNPAAGSNQVGH